MTAGTLLLALAPYGAALLLAALLIAEIAQMLVGRRHPLRILNHALSCAFFLLVAGLLVQIGGMLALVWWVFVALPLIAAAIALARSRIALPTEVTAPTGADRKSGTAAARRTPEAAAARRERRRRRRATRPSVLELAVTLLLFLGAATLWLFAG